MLSFAFLLLPIILTTNLVTSQNNVLPKGFAHLGSFRVAQTNGIDLRNYYISANKVQWSSAQQSCKNAFGTTASTVSVQTVEEWEFLKSILEPLEVVTIYWTMGMYDRTSNVWRWGENSILSSWAPWDSNQPASNPTAIHRVVIAHTNRQTAAWRTVSNSQLHRFICEVPKSTPIPSLCTDSDFVVVLDSSASIGSHNYKMAKKFVVKLAEEFTVHNTNRIALLIYSDTADAIIDINNSLTPAEIEKAIMNAPYLKGSTATHVGIDAAVIQLQSYPRNVTVTKNIVVITEGESNNRLLTAAAAETANNMGIRLFSVGITPSADDDELLLIANGENDNVFTTDECDKLILLVESVARKICPDDQ